MSLLLTLVSAAISFTWLYASTLVLLEDMLIQRNTTWTEMVQEMLDTLIEPNIPWYKQPPTKWFGLMLNAIYKSRVVITVPNFINLMGWLLFFVCFVYTSRSLRRQAQKSPWLQRNYLYYVKGIKVVSYQPEAMMEGSSFSTVETFPRFQVKLSNLKAFATEHVGFACRVRSDILVLPKHVYKHLSANILITSASGKQIAIAKPPCLDSRHIDVVYMPFEESQASFLGVTIATIKYGENFVSIIGEKDGKTVRSTGTTSPMDPKVNHMMVTYTGSTDRGFSGAAYFANSSDMYAMHVGGSENQANYGISANFMLAEMGRIIVHEGKFDMASEKTNVEIHDVSVAQSQHAMTARQHLELSRKYLDDPNAWANMQDESAKSKTKTKKELAEEYLCSLPAEERLDVISRVQGISYVNQSPEGQQEITKVPSNSFDERLTKVEEKQVILEEDQKILAQTVDESVERSNTLEKRLSESVTEQVEEVVSNKIIHLGGRVSSLEGDVQILKQEKIASHYERPVEQVAEQPNQIPIVENTTNKGIKCNYCNRLFLSQAAKMQHVYMKHSVSESAVPADAVRVVTQKPTTFLGRTGTYQNYQRKNNWSYNNPSRFYQEKNHSTIEQREIQQIINMMTPVFENILDRKLKDMPCPPQQLGQN